MARRCLVGGIVKAIRGRLLEEFGADNWQKIGQ
jgi:hypothetical protein